MRKVAPGQLVHHGMGRVTPAKQWPMPSFRMQKSKSLSPPRKSLWSTAGLNANGKTSPPRRGRYSNKAHKQERISDRSPRSPRINQAMDASWRPPRWWFRFASTIRANQSCSNHDYHQSFAILTKQLFISKSMLTKRASACSDPFLQTIMIVHWSFHDSYSSHVRNACIMKYSQQRFDLSVV